MKNLGLLIVSFLLLCSISANAQKSSREKKGKAFHSGVRLGANFSSLSVKDAEFSVVNPAGSLIVNQFQQNGTRATGLVGGVWLRIGRVFYVQPEVLVSAKGGTFDVLQNSAATGTIPQKVSVDFKSTNIDLPFLVGLNIKRVLRIYTGPIASFAIAEGGELKETIKTYTNQSVDKTLKDAVFGYQVGAGLDLKRFKIDVRYEGALTDVSAIKLDKVSDDARFTSKTSLWQVTLGFEIF
ncbi:porin family protein [Persicitalea sp.]|uniref:porin family protein n=1 Tax=Persicitalea sp. TaxID=3100273 RepID=UPI003593B2B1